MHVDRRLLGWGVFFILLGAIPLAVRGGFLDESVVRLAVAVAAAPDRLGPRAPAPRHAGRVDRRRAHRDLFGVMGGGALATGFGGVPMTAAAAAMQPGTAFQAQHGALVDGRPAERRVQLRHADARGRSTAPDWSVAGTDREGGRGPSVETSGATVSIESRGGAFFEDAASTVDLGVPRAGVSGSGVDAQRRPRHGRPRGRERRLGRR